MTSKEALEKIEEELYLILPKNIRDNLIETIKQDLERLEETEKALVETYELNASLRKQVEELEANLKHLNINYKTALKVNNDLLNENRKL